METSKFNQLKTRRALKIRIESRSNPKDFRTVRISADGTYATCDCPHFIKWCMKRDQNCHHINEAYIRATKAAQEHSVADVYEALALIAEPQVEIAPVFDSEESQAVTR